MERETKDKGWRGSREAWLDAAYGALISGGVEAVKIVPLAESLKLSRTSFYWFFKDRKALLSALADSWEMRTTRPLVEAAGAYAESEAEAMLNVIRCFIDEAEFDSRLEFSMRSWANSDDAIRKRIEKADAGRLGALAAMLERFGYPPHEADVRARTVYLVQIGYISMQSREPVATRMTRVPEYVAIYTGKRPKERELARFYAHFGYDPATAEAR